MPARWERRPDTAPSGGRAINLTKPIRDLAAGSTTAYFLGAALSALMLTGCGVQPFGGGAPVDGPDKALVLRTVYETEGQDRAVVFVGVSGASTDELEAIMDELATQIDADILSAELADRSDPDLPALTPVDPETGEIGVSLTLTDMAEVEVDVYEATVFYARNGLDGGSVTLVVERHVDGLWMVTEQHYGSQG